MNLSRSRVGLVAILAVLCAAAVVVRLVVNHAEPVFRAQVIETLSTRFHADVQLDSFHVSMLRGLQVSGQGLRIFGQSGPTRNQPGVQPLIGVAEFRFRTKVWDLFRSPLRVGTVYLKGLQLNLPPREQRAQLNNPRPPGGKIGIVVDRLVADTAQLTVNTQKPGKPPLDFEIETLTMTSVGEDAPMHFEADLINPKPVGTIHTSGRFGPWVADSPRDTAIEGTYSFSHADLATIKGIGGILSSAGQYAGTLDHIGVDGTTETPDFRIAISGRPVPLHTDFHAIVDGISGDTYLQPVNAKLENSLLMATGSIVRSNDPKGHRIDLDVRIDQGRIDDLLRLAIHTDPPVMSGTVRLSTKLDLPPGEGEVADRLRLNGSFQVVQAHFSNPKIQDKVDALSLRSQGKPKLAKDRNPREVASAMKGTFRLSEAVISFSQLQYQMPGTQVDLTGTYSLDGNQFDFLGKVRADAKFSQMFTGWKAILLKPADPFFSKNGAGTEIPVKITGTESEPHFGVDFHDKKNKD